MAEAVHRVDAVYPSIRGTQDIADLFRTLAAQGDYTETGIELGPMTFEANRDSLFRAPNADYVKAEIAWYMSGDPTVDGLVAQYGHLPIVWKQVAGPANGKVHSQYGIRVFGRRSYGPRGRPSMVFQSQYERVVNELKHNPDSRRAIIMYAGRGTMYERTEFGGDDQLCTISVQLLRSRWDGLIYHVHMRSNDAVFGYVNDAAWHHYLITRHLLHDLPEQLTQAKPRIIWTTGALTVYPRHVHLLRDQRWSNDLEHYDWAPYLGGLWDWTPREDEHGGYRGE